jgi:hypothetical protein
LSERITDLMWIAACAALAAAPALFLGSPWGHDSNLHLTMWIDAARQFQQGNLFPHWTAAVNGGFGELSLTFYPPLSWMIGGLLGLIVPWRFVPGLYIFLALALAGIAMWKFAHEWLRPADALLASVVYALNPYLIVNAYKRCAFPELLADALFPLLFWGAIHVARDGRRRIPALTAIFAAIWLADYPAAIVATYSLALLLAINSFLQRSWRPSVDGVAAMIAGFGCVAFVLLPAGWERQWVEIGRAIGPYFLPDANFLLLRLHPHTSFDGAIYFLGTALAVASVAAAVLTRGMRRSCPAIWYPLAALAGTSAFLLYRPSWMLWRILPMLSYVQFPWRCLAPLSAAGSFMAAAAIAATGKVRLMRIAAVIGIFVLAVPILSSVSWDFKSRRLDDMVSAARAGKGFLFKEFGDWRVPLGSRLSALPDAAPLVAPAEQAPDVRIDVQRWTGERKDFVVESPRPVLLKIRLFNYPAWRAQANGAELPLETDPETGQILLTAPTGISRVQMGFVWTWDRTLGMTISILALLLVVLFAWRERTRERRLPAAKEQPSDPALNSPASYST